MLMLMKLKYLNQKTIPPIDPIEVKSYEQDLEYVPNAPYLGAVVTNIW